MKCGSCRNANADYYERIKEDNNLFGILKRLNPRLAYSDKYKYFCSVCINLAKEKLEEILSKISDQFNSVTTLNMSTLSNASESSKDSIDHLVMSKIVFSDTGTPLQIPQNRGQSKRSSEDMVKQKPCPKRFKPLIPIQLSTIQEASSVKDKTSQVQSSESISGDEMLLNVGHDDDSPVSSASFEQPTEQDASVEQQSPIRLQQDLDSLSNKETSNQQPVISVTSAKSRTKTVHIHTQSTVRTKPRPKTLVQYDSSSLSSDETESTSRRATVDTNNTNRQVLLTVQDALPGPSAPAAKSPRIRQENTNIATNLRHFFSNQNFNVNNYSRTLAG